MKGFSMKRIIILIVSLFAIIVLGDLVNKIGANDKMTIEGYILNKEGILYLIEDDDFDLETAKELSSKEIMNIYARVSTLDNVPFSFSGYKDGQKIRV
jgi:hypothetical protein